MEKGAIDQDGFSALTKYVTLLFEQQKGDYLLQFEDDSVLLIYDKGKVYMEIWRKHDGDNRVRSVGFIRGQYRELFGDSKYVQKKL